MFLSTRHHLYIFVIPRLDRVIHNYNGARQERSFNHFASPHPASRDREVIEYANR